MKKIRDMLRAAREWAGDRLAIVGLVLCILWLWLIGGLEVLDDWPDTDPSASPQNDGERRATARARRVKQMRRGRICSQSGKKSMISTWTAPTDTPEGGRETVWEQLS